MNDDWYKKEQLHFAAGRGDLARVKELIAEGYDVNAIDEIGKTPLHYAVNDEQCEVVTYLIEAGADVNAHDEATIGNTPLADVAGKCSLNIARILIEAGADPMIRGWMQLNALDRAKDRKRGEGPEVYRLLLKTAKK
jgi:ankyrin repeat protein